MIKFEEDRFQKYKKTILTIIHQELPDCKVYLFGSRARNEHDNGADIDLALDAGQPIEKKRLFAIQERIEETTIPLSVDLVDLYDASEKLQQEVKEEGIAWEN